MGYGERPQSKVVITRSVKAAFLVSPCFALCWAAALVTCDLAGPPAADISRVNGSPASASTLTLACTTSRIPAAVASAQQSNPGGAKTPPYDAWYYLNRQLGFGPRNPGSPGHRKMREFLVSELSKHADKVATDEFHVHYEDKSYDMGNVVALFRSADGKDSPFMILGAHFDTRPRAERDPDPARRLAPIAGANDGASGVAVLLEIAGVLAHEKPPVPVILVFFDGEDFGPTAGTMFLGSRRFAEKVDPPSVACMILLDMVGDADLDIYVEGNSERSCPDLVGAVWESASRLGYGNVFHNKVAHYIMDDHIPFMDRGIPSMDIIDFDYPYWHTSLDTADKCSPRSLQIVKDVVLHVLFSEEFIRLLKL